MLLHLGNGSFVRGDASEGNDIGIDRHRVNPVPEPSVQACKGAGRERDITIT
jgi:hypothetical protein